jgi:hypothetical protein
MTDFDDPFLADRHADSTSGRGTAARAVAPGKKTLTSQLPARMVARAAANDDSMAPGAGDAIARAAGGSGAPLPADVRGRFESSLGVGLSGVRVHTGTESADAARAVGARAYATGNDIHFASGAYAPKDPFGLHLLAHEVAHTVQQSGAPAMQCKLEVSSPGAAAEREADHAAARMVVGAPVAALVARSAGIARQDHGGTQHPPPTPGTVLDNGELTADTEVTINHRRQTLRAGTYVEVLRNDGAMLHVRAYSGWHAQECDIPHDRFHHQPEISNTRGTDGQPGTTPRDDVSYREVHGGLYGADGQPHMDDIDQGDLGDCSFMAALGTVAQSDPASIRARITASGAHAWTVTFFADDHGGTAPPITVDDHFPVMTASHRASGQPMYAGNDARTIGQAQRRPLWPLVLEKAFAQYRRGYQMLDDGHGDSGSIGGSGSAPHPARSATQLALVALTGRRAHENFDPETYGVLQAVRLPRSPAPSRAASSALRAPPDSLLAELHGYLDSHIPVVLGTGASPHPNPDHLMDPDPTAPRVLADHAYDVRAVDVASRRITLANPWGAAAANQPRPMTPEEVQRLFTDITIGTAPAGGGTGTGATGTGTPSTGTDTTGTGGSTTGR